VTHFNLARVLEGLTFGVVPVEVFQGLIFLCLVAVPSLTNQPTNWLTGSVANSRPWGAHIFSGSQKFPQFLWTGVSLPFNNR